MPLVSVFVADDVVILASQNEVRIGELFCVPMQVVDRAVHRQNRVTIQKVCVLAIGHYLAHVGAILRH